MVNLFSKTQTNSNININININSISKHDNNSKSNNLNDKSAKSSMDETRSASEWSSSTSRERSNNHNIDRQNQRKVWMSRTLFLVGLVVIAGFLGWLGYAILKSSETQKAEVHFKSIADRALSTSREIVQRKRLGTVSMADTVAWSQPQAEDWPFVVVLGYEELATNLIETSKARTLGLCPFVTPTQREEFEDFAYDYFENTREPTFPNGTAVSSFGKGLWRRTSTSPENPDGRLPVPIDASNTWGSPNAIFAPILQHSTGNKAPVLLLNINFEPTRGVMVDDMIACSQERALSDDPKAFRCGVLTDMLNLATQEEDSGPDAILMEPIFPARDPTTLVGFIGSSIIWRESLQNVFAGDVSGVDCVLRTPQEIYTYGVQDGVPFVRGRGDLHDRSYDKYREAIDIVTQGDFSPTSATYVLEVYPTHEFFDTYSTSNPIVGLCGAIGIILLISVLFYTYDCFVRKEFDHNQELLEAKRRFVRFVSHEVRTPLNTVSMGLTLLQDELATASGRNLSSSSSSPPSSSSDNNNNHKITNIKKDESHLPKTVVISQEAATEWIQLSDEILTNTQTAVDVLNDLLNYDKIQRGKLSLELSVIRIWRLLEQTVTEFKLMAAENNVTLKLDFQKLQPTTTNDDDDENNEDEEAPVMHVFSLGQSLLECVVVGDAIRVSQVLRNLISNGLKFTPEKGSLTVQVKLAPPTKEEAASEKEFDLSNDEKRSLPPRGRVVIDFIDTGVGMSKSQLQTVFQDGVQFNSNKLQAGNGSGLGLFIAKGICEQHEGTLQVDSKGLGFGTIFTATFPLFHEAIVASSEQSLHQNVEHLGSAENTQDNFPQRILVVDDSTPNRKLLIRLLQNRGHTCTGANDGREALLCVKEAKEDPYDTILLDYEMPEMNGPTVCQKIRELGCSSFVAGVTGNLMPEDVAHFKTCGASAVLGKPFKMVALEQLWMEYGVSGRGTDDNNVVVQKPFLDSSEDTKTIILLERLE